MAISQRYLNSDENVVVSTRTHPKALILPLLVGLGVLAAASWVSVAVGGLGAIVAWVVAAGLIVWFTLRPVVIWLTTTYTFTDRRFLKRSGFVAKQGRTIPLNRISGVDFEMGVLDRLFGCGTLVVTDASSSGHVELRDIPKVEQVQLIISDELARIGSSHGRAERSDDGT